MRFVSAAARRYTLGQIVVLTAIATQTVAAAGNTYAGLEKYMPQDYDPSPLDTLFRDALRESVARREENARRRSQGLPPLWREELAQQRAALTANNPKLAELFTSTRDNIGQASRATGAFFWRTVSRNQDVGAAVGVGVVVLVIAGLLTGRLYSPETPQVVYSVEPPAEEETQTAAQEPTETEAAAEEAPAETTEMAAAEEEAPAEAEAMGGDDSELLSLIASADPAAGESIFRQCAACHNIADGAANKVGPNLYGVVGREIGVYDGFRYSNTLAEMGGVWDAQALSGFLENPSDWAPGTKMSYRGLRDQEDRVNMIAYLNQQSNDQPLTD